MTTKKTIKAEEPETLRVNVPEENQPVETGQEAIEPIVEPIEPTIEPNPGDAQKEVADKMKPYFDAYPGNDLFYITSDGQVFLEKDHPHAANHQRSLKEGQLKTIKRP